MLTNLNYLNSLKSYLRVDPAIKDDLIREIEGHLEDKSLELKESGFTDKDATETAEQLFGAPWIIAQQIYEVYSQGGWRQALFAALPHLLIALLFAMRWWHNTIWLSVVILAVISTVIYGWCHGKPTWLFPWLGYLLVPVVVAGVLLIYLPGDWTWFAILAYVPIALFLLISVILQTLKRDWLFVSLMLLPVPIVLGWVVALSIGNKFMEYEQIREAAPWIAFSFVILALTVATFIRVRRRWLKTGALLAPEILILVVLALANKDAINFWGWLVLTLLALFFLLGPALLERKAGEKTIADH